MHFVFFLLYSVNAVSVQLGRKLIVWLGTLSEASGRCSSSLTKLTNYLLFQWHFSKNFNLVKKLLSSSFFSSSLSFPFSIFLLFNPFFFTFFHCSFRFFARFCCFGIFGTMPRKYGTLWYFHRRTAPEVPDNFSTQTINFRIELCKNSVKWIYKKK